MSYFKVCPTCGCALDPNEICTDCQTKENARAGAANTGVGGVETVVTDHLSASIITENGGFVK